VVEAVLFATAVDWLDAVGPEALFPAGCVVGVDRTIGARRASPRLCSADPVAASHPAPSLVLAFLTASDTNPLMRD
jgi:hypothetical protein